MRFNRIRTRIAAGTVAAGLALTAGLGHVAVAAAQPNNGGGWDKEGFLNCLRMQPPDSNPHDWAIACCVQNGGHPTDDGTCHPPDSSPQRQKLAEILQPATITPRQPVASPSR
jgi:invasion protein IalB